MGSVRVIVSAMVLVVACLPSTLSFDYSPCEYQQIPSENLYGILCLKGEPSDILEAFHRNSNNSEINFLDIVFLNDLTDDNLAEILEVVAFASANVTRMAFSDLPKMEKVPAALQKFPKLNTLTIQNTGITTIPSGSMVSPSHSYISLYDNKKLTNIEVGAFQGNYDSSWIVLSGNNLAIFDEKIFKPLFSDFSLQMTVTSNKISCDSCSLAWVIRSISQYSLRMFGNCKLSNGKEITFEEVDPETLKDC